MAIISTFELLAKRIGPPGGIPWIPPTYTPFRKLLQGYYLTIANPNDRNVRLRMQAVIPKKNACSPFDDAERELTTGAISVANHVYAYDRTGCNIGTANPREILSTMKSIGSTSTSKSFSTTNILLEPYQTGLVNLVPSPVAIADQDPQIEIRGYIRIVQVQTWKFVISRPPGFGFFQLVKPKPVTLLFTPEIRGTFVDDEFSPFNTNWTGEYDYDQSNYALPTYTGAGAIEVKESVSPFILCLPNFPILDLSKLIKMKDLKVTRNSMGFYSFEEKSIELMTKTLKKKGLKQGQIKEGIMELQSRIQDIE